MDHEAVRILTRLDGMALGANITPNARQFLERKLGVMKAHGGQVHVTINELWWLRTINEKTD